MYRTQLISTVCFPHAVPEQCYRRAVRRQTIEVTAVFLTCLAEGTSELG